MTAAITCRSLTNPKHTLKLEILVGRTLAMCVHPFAAWRASSSKRRIFVIVARAVGSYGVVLGPLFAR
jgi:hypothetical protein